MNSPDVWTSAVNGIVTAGPVAVLLAVAVVYFARRDAKRDAERDAREVREREDRLQLATVLAQNTAALVEFRRADEETRRAIEALRLALERAKP
jgi:hypothetical protein